MESITIKKKEIKLSEIKKLAKLKNGVYSIIYKDGKTIKSFMMKDSIGNAAIKILSERDSESQSALNKASDQPFEKSAPNFNIEKVLDDLERQDFLSVDHLYKNPNHVPYWESSENTAKRRQMGYVFTKPDDLIDFSSHFRDVNIGVDANPDGLIQRQGLVLMHTTIEIRDAIRKHNASKKSQVEEIHL